MIGVPLPFNSKRNDYIVLKLSGLLIDFRNCEMGGVDIYSGFSNE